MERKARRQFTSKFKAKVALEALKEQKTLSQIADQYELHQNQVSDWKKAIADRLPELFETERKGKNNFTDSEDPDIELITAPLYQQIGQQKVELDFLKKKLKHLEH
jgi:transposase-like protein